jgi:hypothetical protein
MIIEIDVFRKSFWVMIAVVYLVLNWASLILLGIMGTERSKHFDLGDSLVGFCLIGITVAWWFSE